MGLCGHRVAEPGAALRLSPWTGLACLCLPCPSAWVGEDRLCWSRVPPHLQPSLELLVRDLEDIHEAT